MAQPKTFFQRMGHQGLCVLLSDVVDAESANTSDPFKQFGPDSLCYASLTTIRTIGEDEYLARVSPTPDLAGAYTVLLTEDQLRYCLPFDARLESRSPYAIRTAICTHARELQPVRALPVEPSHFLKQLRSQQTGTIAAEAGAFESVTLRLATTTTDIVPETPVHSDMPVVDFPLTAQDVNEAILPFKGLQVDPSHPRIHALLKLLHFDIVLKAIDNRRATLMESLQTEFAEALAHLGEMRERVKLLRLAQGNSNARQPIARANVHGLKRKGGLGKRGGGFFIIEKALIEPLVA